VLNYHIVRKINKLVERTVAEVIRGWSDNWVSDEHNITTNLFTRLEEQMKNISVNGLRLKVKYYAPQGPRSEEKRTGADIGVVLDVNLPGFTIKKAFLAQAKRCPVAKKDRLCELTGCLQSKLLSQCQDMLRITPDSFVFIYYRQGVLVVPASSIEAICGKLNRKRQDKVYSKKLGSFFEEFLKSFIGDTRIAGSINNVGQLENFSREFGLRHCLYIALGET